MKKNERLLLPMIIFIFLVNYHFYRFYEKNFNKIFKYLDVKPSLVKNQYEKVQAYHPFYFVYKASEEYKGKKDKVHYFYSTKDFENELDIHELYVRFNYFFYPSTIKPVYEFEALKKIPFKPGDLIITDKELIGWQLNQKLERIKITGVAIEDQDYFNKRGQPFYIYKLL